MSFKAPHIESRINTLLTMLTYKRPARSESEEAFIARYITSLGTLPDGYGNYWLTIGDSPILWSSHTDTVHKTPGMQKVVFGDGIATVHNGECLGADCTAGVWLMRQMILAGIPGTYVFHRDEEIGGKGSQYIATKTPDRLRGIDFAIAFDRQGDSDVITHQAYGRTASNEFARSFSAATGLKSLKPCGKGIFTDTANYSHLVSECSNISVGYYDNHRPAEMLDVNFLSCLLSCILTADFRTLACSRDPNRDEYEGGYGFDDRGPFVDLQTPSGNDLEEFAFEHPEIVARFIEEMGYSVDDLYAYVESPR